MKPTNRDGSFSFPCMDLSIDYEIYAECGNVASEKLLISSSDTRREIIVRLRLDKRKPKCLCSLNGCIKRKRLIRWCGKESRVEQAGSRCDPGMEHLRNTSKTKRIFCSLDGTTVEQLGPNSKQHHTTKYKKRQGEAAP